MLREFTCAEIEQKFAGGGTPTAIEKIYNDLLLEQGGDLYTDGFVKFLKRYISKLPADKYKLLDNLSKCLFDYCVHVLSGNYDKLDGVTTFEFSQGQQILEFSCTPDGEVFIEICSKQEDGIFTFKCPIYLDGILFGSNIVDLCDIFEGKSNNTGIIEFNCDRLMREAFAFLLLNLSSDIFHVGTVVL